MKRAEEFRKNAGNCAYLAENASDEPARQRFQRMERAWLALAAEQDWLNGEISPLRQNTGNARLLARY